MKKLIIGAIVGGIIIFIWQSLSFTALNLHAKAFQYTPKQQELITYLGTQFDEEGQYLLPRSPDNASREEMEAHMKSADGRPWAMISYHKAMDMNMAMNMIRGLVVDILAAGLLCWILLKMSAPSFSTILISSIFIGLIVFMNGVYTGHIWYQTFDIMAHFLDAIVAWGACGLWLGWWLNRGR
jgi:hypothetical protein